MTSVQLRGPNNVYKVVTSDRRHRMSDLQTNHRQLLDNWVTAKAHATCALKANIKLYYVATSSSVHIHAEGTVSIWSQHSQPSVCGRSRI